MNQYHFLAVKPMLISCQLQTYWFPNISKSTFQREICKKQIITWSFRSTSDSFSLKIWDDDRVMKQFELDCSWFDSTGFVNALMHFENVVHHVLLQPIFQMCFKAEQIFCLEIFKGTCKSFTVPEIFLT